MLMSIQRHSATIATSLVFGAVGAVGGLPVTASPTSAVQPTVDRAALEALLTEEPITPTGRTKRF